MYDKQEVFKKHIQKKADELNDLCKSLGIVSFMSFAVKDDGKTTDYKNYIYGSASNRITLTDEMCIRDRIPTETGLTITNRQSLQDVKILHLNIYHLKHVTHIQRMQDTREIPMRNPARRMLTR